MLIFYSFHYAVRARLAKFGDKSFSPSMLSLLWSLLFHARTFFRVSLGLDITWRGSNERSLPRIYTRGSTVFETCPAIAIHSLALLSFCSFCFFFFSRFRLVRFGLDFSWTCLLKQRTLLSFFIKTMSSSFFHLKNSKSNIRQHMRMLRSLLLHVILYSFRVFDILLQGRRKTTE